jgi:hypothetical protein
MKRRTLDPVANKRSPPADHRQERPPARHATGAQRVAQTTTHNDAPARPQVPLPARTVPLEELFTDTGAEPDWLGDPFGDDVDAWVEQEHFADTLHVGEPVAGATPPATVETVETVQPTTAPQELLGEWHGGAWGDQPGASVPSAHFLHSGYFSQSGHSAGGPSVGVPSLSAPRPARSVTGRLLDAVRYVLTTALVGRKNFAELRVPGMDLAAMMVAARRATPRHAKQYLLLAEQFRQDPNTACPDAPSAFALLYLAGGRPLPKALAHIDIARLAPHTLILALDERCRRKLTKVWKDAAPCPEFYLVMGPAAPGPGTLSGLHPVLQVLQRVVMAGFVNSQQARDMIAQSTDLATLHARMWESTAAVAHSVQRSANQLYLAGDFEGARWMTLFFLMSGRAPKDEVRAAVGLGQMITMADIQALDHVFDPPLLLHWLDDGH